jgi:hypothetical protein
MLAGPVLSRTAGAATRDDILKDWMTQDHGQNAGGCFTNGNGSDTESRMVEKVLSQLNGTGAEIRNSLAKLKGSRKPGNDPSWRELYVKACEARRAKRLAPMLEKWKRIVFTKHFNMGGSHYAYTEGQSDAQAERHFKAGTALCLLEMDGVYGKVKTLIEDAKGVIRDPDVSYDGKRILFSWKKSDRQDDYHLYDMDVATGKTRQLTSGLGFADYECCYLPNGDILFNSSRCVQTVDCWWTEVSNLYTCDKDGKYLRRISFDQVHTNYPQVMDNGRVTYTRWDYNDRGQLYPQPLYQMNPDGTGQTEFYGNNSWFPTTIIHARNIPGSMKMLAIATGHHSYQRGKVCIVDPALGRQETSGILLVAPVVANKRDGIYRRKDSWGQGGQLFEYPYPLNDRQFLVTFATDGRGRGRGHFSIHFMDIDGKRELLAHDPKISCNQSVPLVPRRIPHHRPSVVDYRKKTGTYYMQDVYVGPGLKGIPRGTAKRLRVVALEYRPAGVGRNGNRGPGGGALVSTPISINNGSWDVKVVLGSTPIYKDGSAFFEVPARTPVYFQVLDAKNHVVQTMRSWSTLQPGEKFSCVGCHENKDNTPVPDKTSIAMSIGAKPLEEFYGPPRGFSFPKEIQPILDKHCIRCHKNRKGGKPGRGGGGPQASGPYIAVDLGRAKTLLRRGSLWYYTTSRPKNNWYKPEYSSSGWKRAQAGFGTAGTPGGKKRTDWRTKEIWLRTTLKLGSSVANRKLAFAVCHDEDVTIYVNGIRAAAAGGYITGYKALPVASEAARSLKIGDNLIAVHCRQTSGGQYIDVGLVDAGPLEKPREEPKKVEAPAAKTAFSLLGEPNVDNGAKRKWSDSYLALTQRGRPNNIVRWMNVQSIPPMLPPYFAGAAKSDLIKMHAEGGHNKVRLSQEELDKIACWIDLLVPYCGDYAEANCWDDRGRRNYDKFLSKRRRMEEIERQNIEALIKAKTGKAYRFDPRPAWQTYKPAPVSSSAPAGGTTSRNLTYRNLALNPGDMRDAVGYYPHASSNSEYGNKAPFLALNAINGRTENKGHGGRFPSWGPDKRTDLWWKVEFGKAVETDKIVLYIRADFPHDRHWHSATIEFSDGTREKVTIRKTAGPQTFRFRKRATTSVKFTDLVQAEPLGWCGFSEVQVWGRDAPAGRKR